MSTIQILEKSLADLGIEIAQTRVRRLKTLHEIRRVHALAEGGNKNALHGLGPLRKSADDDGRLVLSLERQIADEKRRLNLARAQSAVAAAKQAASGASRRGGDENHSNRTYRGAGRTAGLGRRHG